MTSTSQQFQITVVGAPDFITEIEGDAGENDPSLAFVTTMPDNLDELLDDTDCLVLDQETIGETQDTFLNRVTCSAPSLPIIVLVTDASGPVVQAAIQAGATDYLPRSLCESNPSLVRTQLASFASDGTPSAGTNSGVIDAVDVAVSVLHPESGEFLSVNRHMAEWLGVTRNALVGHPIDAVRIGPTEHDRDSLSAVLTRVANSGNPETREVVLDPENGRSRTLDATIRPIPDTDQPGVVLTGRPVARRESQQSPTPDRRFELVTENVEYVNSAYEDIWARPVEDLYEDATAFIDGIDPRDRDSFESEFEAMREEIKTGEPDDSYEFEFRVRQPNGTIRWVLATGTPVTTETGESRYVGIVEDITDRRERQQNLEAERDRRSILFENTPDPIVAVEFKDRQPYITEVNSAFADTFGFDAEQVSDSPIADVVVPEEEWNEYERIKKQALAGDSVETEVRRKTADGVRDFLVRVLPFESAEGRHAYIWYTDITERKRRERAIEEERQKYTTLVEQSTDGVAVVSDGTYVFVNEKFAEITGYDRSALLEMPFYEVFTPTSRELVIERYERRVAGESPPNQYDVEIETPDGRRVTLELSVSRIHHEGEPATLANFRDVTERRRRERTIEQLQTAIERLQEAETRADVYRIAVETTRDVLELPMTACWRYEDTEDHLTYVAGTEPVEEIPNGPVSFTPGDKEYAVFEREDAITYDPSQHHESNPLDAAIIVSLGNQGLLAAGRQGREEYESYLVDVTQVLAGHAASALERVNRSEQLRESQHRLQAIVDRIDEVIFLAPVSELDKAELDPEFTSSGYEKIWGQPLKDIAETYKEGFFGTLHTDDYEGYRTFIDRIVSDVEDGDPDQRYTRVFRIVRPDGEVRWVQSDFYPTELEGETPRIMIVSRDITERKQRERTLESFQDATAELTTADTVTDACRIAVEAAATVFDIPATAVYHYDAETAVLEPTATGPEIPDATALEPRTSEDTEIWEPFVGETMHRVDFGNDTEMDVGPSDEGLLLPLGGNGILAVWESDGSLDTDAASILAATLEAALNRLRGERELESRRAELEAQSERARRLESITELTQRIEAAITTQSSRQGIREAVCAELVNVEPFSGAWIAGAEVGTDQLTPRTVVGLDQDSVEQVFSGGSPDPADPHPVAAAWETGETHVVNKLFDSRRRSDWRQFLLKAGASGICAVPLAYAGITYGVLAIVADEPDSFGERELAVLTQLGASIGYAITSIGRQRALESDHTLELEFRGTDMDLPFVQLARELGCRVRHERTIRRQDGSVSVYYTLLGEVPTDIAQTARVTLPGDIDIVSRQDGRAVIERRGSSWFGSTVSEYGGVLRRCRATSDDVTLIVELPQESDTRSIVERIQDEFPALELTAQRQHRERNSTPGEVQDQLQQRLSDRQYEALETAYATGYFEWPRESSGEDVARQLDITQPTVNKHIRLGEQKVFDLLFGSDAD